MQCDQRPEILCQGSLQFLLLSDGAVPVNALASKEAMTHHALTKQ
jgi:hypothetical protein